jgi:hypothetical protein
MMVLALLFASVVVVALITALWLTRDAIPNSCYHGVGPYIHSHSW